MRGWSTNSPAPALVQISRPGSLSPGTRRSSSSRTGPPAATISARPRKSGGPPARSAGRPADLAPLCPLLVARLGLHGDRERMMNIFDAARAGDAASVQACLDAGADVSAV